MTAPGPHNPPLSRRAARSLRDRDVERAVEPPAQTLPLPVVGSPLSRRDAKAAEIMDPDATPAQHARDRRATGIGTVFGVIAAAALVLGSAAAVTAAVAGAPVSDTADANLAATADAAVTSEPVEAKLAAPVPAPAQSIPAPTIEAAPAVVDICAIPAFTAAVAAGDDAGAIAAAGGPEQFRVAIASGIAPCVPLSDPAHVWVVINKARPLDPLEYSPTPLSAPEGVRNNDGGSLRSDAAAALSAMVTAAGAAGVGEIGLGSGYRSYATQRSTYNSQVGAEGVEQAELSSARPGFSEHQSGLAGDVVPCGSDGCGTLDDLAATSQGQWVAANAWQYGWIVRYIDGSTPVSGYLPEPWHLRYIGPELARSYHDGGWRTLEEFFGLPAAPDYLG